MRSYDKDYIYTCLVTLWSSLFIIQKGNIYIPVRKATVQYFKSSRSWLMEELPTIDAENPKRWIYVNTDR